MLRLYYCLKPLIPDALQVFLRRQLIHRKMRSCAALWPIDEAAGKAPEGWNGWPGGKQFAFVITHDVEGMKGVDKCLEVANLDSTYGFRSSFNFVCRDYVVPTATMNSLRNAGFEIGVHGLTHRGNSFRSATVFDKQLKEINHFIGAWGASGFRSPSMYHNLEWIRRLDIEYDASTFDTDPFEPQPDGVRTIFPFVVSSKNDGRRYVELPYTLPQDHTLFIFLKEPTIEIWKRKVDWIAEKGGLALFIAHPDYMAMRGGKQKTKEYPVERYIELLKYVATRYEGKYWHVLPRDLARFWGNRIRSSNLEDENESLGDTKREYTVNRSF
jgi:hypothetical protein